MADNFRRKLLENVQRAEADYVTAIRNFAESARLLHIKQEQANAPLSKTLEEIAEKVVEDIDKVNDMPFVIDCRIKSGNELWVSFAPVFLEENNILHVFPDMKARIRL
jgi:hypothetical protein